MLETKIDDTRAELMEKDVKAPIQEHELDAKAAKSLAQESTPASNVVEKLNEHTQSKEDKLDSLEQWANKLFASEFPTVELGRYGMKTPSDVIKFIKSPAGEVLIGELKTHHAEERRMIEEIQLKQREESFFKLLLRVSLILMYMEGKAHSSDKVKELILEQNKKSVELAKKVSTPTAAATQQNQRAQLGADYDKVISQMTARHKNLTQEMTTLEQEQQLLEAAGLEINSRFEELALGLNDNEQHDDEPSQSAMEEHLASIEEHLAAVYDKLDLNPDDATGKIEATKLNLQRVDLEDRLNVLLGKKYLVNAQGEQVSSFKDHAFILDREMKLVVENGVNYLIRQNQDWNEVKENPEARHKAQQRAESLDNLSAKKICQHHHGVELEKHGSFVHALANKLMQCVQERTMVNNQMLLLQGAKASAQNLINEPGLNHQIPTPAPTMKAQAQPNIPQHVTLQYKEQIQKLKSLSDYSQWWQLEPSLPKEVRTEIQKQAEFRNMPRSGPIPQQSMQFMLRTLERFSVDTTKPGVTPIKSPTDIKLEQQHESTAPSPFSMKPTPFK